MNVEDFDENMIISQMMEWTEENAIFYIADLWAYAEKERENDWFVVLKNRNSYLIFREHFKEKRATARRKRIQVPPPANSWHDGFIIYGRWSQCPK
ncbi:MAG: hypothetical protein FWC70_08985 [Defluviitaleaceae bacterium]|nr:hypothetical protein [Defluviitaleaceae bacterium]